MSKNTGGSWENIGRRWGTDSNPPTVRMRSRYYEEHSAGEKLIYGPSGDVISRVVDPEPKMGFRSNKGDKL